MARRILPLLVLGAIVAGWRAQPLNAKPENQIPPGPARIEIACESSPSNLRVLHLERVLGKHDVRSP